METLKKRIEALHLDRSGYINRGMNIENKLLIQKDDLVFLQQQIKNTEFLLKENTSKHAQAEFTLSILESVLKDEELLENNKIVKRN